MRLTRTAYRPSVKIENSSHTGEALRRSRSMPTGRTLDCRTLCINTFNCDDCETLRGLTTPEQHRCKNRAHTTGSVPQHQSGQILLHKSSSSCDMLRSQSY